MEWLFAVAGILVVFVLTENFLTVREDIRVTRKTVEEILETLRERG
jgi:hypothetical protein